MVKCFAWFGIHNILSFVCVIYPGQYGDGTCQIVVKVMNTIAEEILQVGANSTCDMINCCYARITVWNQ